jgi:hypothetical protein
MPFKKNLLALAVLPLALGGCGVLGAGSATSRPGPSASASPGPATGAGWIVTAPGSATPSPAPSRGTGTLGPALPKVSFLALGSGCAQRSRIDEVLIPITVTPAVRSLTVTWARQYDSGYRITAVPQPLVAGSQPNYTWKTVAPASGCTVSTTIGGLKSGKPYVVWLDAPATGYERDGTRHPYSGRSGVVYPR